MKLAVGEAQLAMIDVDVADGGLGKGAALRAALFVLGQSANAVTDEAAVERAAGELRDRRRRQPNTSSSGRSVRRLNSTIMASSACVRTVLRGCVGPMGRSTVVVRPRHLSTVFGFSP
jgi:hypothetical protein